MAVEYDNEKNELVYKEFTQESFTEELDRIFKHDAIERQLVLITGDIGMKEFDHAIRVRVFAESCDMLLEQNKITQEEYARLLSMLHSPDRENYQVAIAIIDIKTKENGSIL